MVYTFGHPTPQATEEDNIPAERSPLAPAEDKTHPEGSEMDHIGSVGPPSAPAWGSLGVTFPLDFLHHPPQMPGWGEGGGKPGQQRREEESPGAEETSLVAKTEG